MMERKKRYGTTRKKCEKYGIRSVAEKCGCGDGGETLGKGRWARVYRAVPVRYGTADGPGLFRIRVRFWW